MKSLTCPNRRCSRLGKAAAGSIIRHGFYTTSCGKRRRYRCRICGKTLSSNSDTPYYRLQHRRATFDEVAALSYGGIDSPNPRAGGGPSNRFWEKKFQTLAAVPKTQLCASTHNVAFVTDLRSNLEEQDIGENGMRTTQNKNLCPRTSSARRRKE
jgi:hypothetical protein